MNSSQSENRARISRIWPIKPIKISENLENPKSLRSIFLVSINELGCQDEFAK